MTIDQSRWTALAEDLADAQRSGVLRDLPARDCLPANASDSYFVQDRVIAWLEREPRAWKLGATALAAQANFGLSEPFSGPVLQGRVLISPAEVDVSGYACHVFEPEIAITLASDLVGPVDARTAHDAIASYHPAIELINFRYRNGRSLDALGMITDGGANGALVLGPASDPSDFDYVSVTLDMRINGKTVANRFPPPPETEISGLLAWFSGHLAARGYILRKGDVITTGSQAGVIEYAPGDRIEADFGALGIASARF